MLRLLMAAALAVAGLTLMGCDQGRTDPPNANVLVVHADPTLADVTFKRVQVNSTPLVYKGSATFSFDVDTYTFNFDILAPNGAVVETVSTTHELVSGTDYIIVLRSASGQPTVRVIEAPTRTTATGGTQVQLLHTAATVGAVDIFVEPVGFDVLAAAPWGTVSNGGELPPTLFSGGDYELAVTEAGNPSNVLLRSTSFTLGASEDLFLFIADGAGEGLAPFTIALARAEGGGFVDASIESGIRVLNATGDRGAIDAGIDLELAPPLIPNIAFGMASDQTLVPVGDRTVTITPAGNPGVIAIDQAFTAVRGALGTVLVSGPPGSVAALFVADDFRAIPGEAKFRVFQASPASATVDVFVLPPGTSPSVSNMMATIGIGSATTNRRLLAGDYDLTIRTSGTTTVLAGPTPITVAAEGYYAVLLADAVGGSGLEIIYLDDFN